MARATMRSMPTTSASICVHWIIGVRELLPKESFVPEEPHTSILRCDYNNIEMGIGQVRSWLCLVYRAFRNWVELIQGGCFDGQDYRSASANRRVSHEKVSRVSCEILRVWSGARENVLHLLPEMQCRLGGAPGDSSEIQIGQEENRCGVSAV